MTSFGCRSGVHWIRDGIAPSTDWAIARASTVFAVPGTSSKSTWPPHASALRTSRISSVLPWTTVSMFSRSRAAIAAARATRPSASTSAEALTTGA